MKAAAQIHGQQEKKSNAMDPRRIFEWADGRIRTEFTGEESIAPLKVLEIMRNGMMHGEVARTERRTPGNSGTAPSACHTKTLRSISQPTDFLHERTRGGPHELNLQGAKPTLAGLANCGVFIIMEDSSPGIAGQTSPRSSAPRTARIRRKPKSLCYFSPVNVVCRAMQTRLSNRDLTEPLEARQLLSASLVGSTLIITGTPKADIIVLSQDATNVYVNENGALPEVFTAAQVQLVAIDLGAGNDQVSLQKKNGSQALRIPAVISGGAGNDFMRGGAANDTLSGGAGDDTLDGGAGADSFVGGAGNDTVDYSSRTNAVTISLDNTANDGELNENDNITDSIETVIGGSGNDSFTGNALANTFEGGPGNDSFVDAGAGNDTLLGGPGDDIFYEDPGSDLIVGGDGSDTMYYISTVSKDPVYVNLDGLANDGYAGENDNVQVENVVGGDGNDTLIGDDNDNRSGRPGRGG